VSPRLNRFQHLGLSVQAAAPYALIKDAESLIQTLEGLNTALVTRRRDHVLQPIDAHITRDEVELDAAQISNDPGNQ